LANELSVCILLLLQTQKHSTPDIADPLLSMRCIKGASVIEQACTLVTTMWREGYNPRTVDDDKYISFAAVKNRIGSLWTGDFAWDGVRGQISEMAQEQQDALQAFRNRKKDQKIKEAEANSLKGWH
jgi:replicative DNA helicase